MPLSKETETKTESFIDITPWSNLTWIDSTY